MLGGSFGFSIMSTIIIIGFVLTFGLIIFSFIKAARNKAYNASQPQLTVDATVVDKRTHVNSSSAGNDFPQSTHSMYYATFEFSSGDRAEFRVPVDKFGYLVVGDSGSLTFRGTEFIDFDRSRDGVGFVAR